MSKMYTIDELMQMWRVSRHWIDTQRAKGNLPPGYRLGRRVMYRESDIEKFLIKRMESE